jgi:hypothetical protein
MMTKIFYGVAFIVVLAFSAIGGIAYAPTLGEFMGLAIEQKREVEDMPNRRPPKTSFVDVGELIFPVIRDGRTHAYLIMEPSIQIPDDRRETIRSQLPRVRDAILLTMHSGPVRELLAGDEYDLSTVKRRIQDATKSVIGPDAQAIVFNRFVRQEARV